MTAASEELFHVSSGRIRWERITLQWPRNGPSLANCPSVKIVTRAALNRWSRADVTVKESGHPLLGNQLPWTEQFGPCGTPSLDGVSVPAPFIPPASGSRTDKVKAARLLVRQWIKSRYGVFDETGYQGDAQYPLTASELGAFGPANASVVLNSCTVPNVLLPTPKAISSFR